MPYCVAKRRHNQAIAEPGLLASQQSLWISARGPAQFWLLGLHAPRLAMQFALSLLACAAASASDAGPRQCTDIALEKAQLAEGSLEELEEQRRRDLVSQVRDQQT